MPTYIIRRSPTMPATKLFQPYRPSAVQSYQVSVTAPKPVQYVAARPLLSRTALMIPRFMPLETTIIIPAANSFGSAEHNRRIKDEPYKRAVNSETGTGSVMDTSGRGAGDRVADAPRTVVKPNPLRSSGTGRGGAAVSDLRDVMAGLNNAATGLPKAARPRNLDDLLSGRQAGHTPAASRNQRPVPAKTTVSPKPAVNTVPSGTPKFKKGDAVFYVKNGERSPATVSKVHTESLPVHYDISITGTDREPNTNEENLRSRSADPQPFSQTPANANQRPQNVNTPAFPQQTGAANRPRAATGDVTPARGKPAKAKGTPAENTGQRRKYTYAAGRSGGESTTSRLSQAKKSTGTRKRVQIDPIPQVYTIPRVSPVTSDANN